jgi:hypothetical protein
MVDHLSAPIAELRFALTLIGILEWLVPLLAVLGAYGVTSYSVARRTSEMGTRAALGPTRADLVRMVLRVYSTSVAAGSAALPTGAAFTGCWLPTGAARLAAGSRSQFSAPINRPLAPRRFRMTGSASRLRIRRRVLDTCLYVGSHSDLADRE